jgi:hypothetical protein
MNEGEKIWKEAVLAYTKALLWKDSKTVNILMISCVPTEIRTDNLAKRNLELHLFAKRLIRMLV